VLIATAQIGVSSDLSNRARTPACQQAWSCRLRHPDQSTPSGRCPGSGGRAPRSRGAEGCVLTDQASIEPVCRPPSAPVGMPRVQVGHLRSSYLDAYLSNSGGNSRQSAREGPGRFGPLAVLGNSHQPSRSNWPEGLPGTSPFLLSSSCIKNLAAIG
jgi:hypothetical protein